MVPLLARRLVRSPGVAVPRCLFATAGEFVAARGPFAEVDASDVAEFQRICDSVLVADDTEDLATYTTDWMGKWSGRSRVVLRPSSTQQVSAVLRHCSARRIAVVPQGGKTGLVGGSVPVHDEVVLNLTRMSKIEAFDADSGVVTCEAGTVLESLDAYLNERGFTAPLDLGAKGTCTVGGNVATCAGGVRFVRYGSLRGSVVGLEVVLADGTVLDILNTLRKDNTGYALPQLFIGSEGTLGVVTKVALCAPPACAASSVAYFACADFQGVRDTLKLARGHCAEILSAIEFADAVAVDYVTQAEAGLEDPLKSSAAPFRVLVETRGSSRDHDAEKLQKFLEAAVEGGAVVDGVVAPDSETAKRQIWRLREGISDAMTAAGYVYKYDVSLPLDHMYALVEEARNRLAPFGADVAVAGYGHVADSNLHLNVCALRGDDPGVRAALEPWVFHRVAHFRGSISAEHGIGQCKPAYLHLAKAAPAIHLMRTLKHALDPQNILNPYKVLPPAPAPAPAENPSPPSCTVGGGS